MPPSAPRPPLTHFLCIPLLTTHSKHLLRTSLSTFKSTVTTLSTPELPNGIPASAIRPLGTLHLTLGVMSLTTPERVSRAVEVLKGMDLRRVLREVEVGKGKKMEGGKASVETSVDESTKYEEGVDSKNPQQRERGKVLEAPPAPLTLSLKSLQSMQAPSSTSILYAVPYDATGRLQRFAEWLKDVFIDAGVMVKEDRPLLLHATIVNMVYVKEGGRFGGGGRGGTVGRGGRGGRGHGKSKARMKIDAKEVLEMFDNTVWADGFKVDRVAICRMGARKVERKKGGDSEEDGKYQNGGERGSEDESDEEYIVEEEVEMPV